MAEVFKRHSCQITPRSFLRLSVLIFGLKFHNIYALANYSHVLESRKAKSRELLDSVL